MIDKSYWWTNSAAAAQEQAEPEARGIDNAAPQVQDPAVTFYAYNDVMAIFKDISARIDDNERQACLSSNNIVLIFHTYSI
jgi:hypothetical protein